MIVMRLNRQIAFEASSLVIASAREAILASACFCIQKKVEGALSGTKELRCYLHTLDDEPARWPWGLGSCKKEQGESISVIIYDVESTTLQQL